MNCQDFLSRYSDFVDGLLAPLDAAALHQHLVSCQRCARYDQVMQRGLELARAMPTVEPSSDFHLRLQHRLLHVRDDAADAGRAGSGAAVSLAIAGLLALAAWGPLLLRGDGETVMTADAPARPMVEAAALPMPVQDGGSLRGVPGESAWWAPASLTTPPRPLTGAFPGPYSPLVVTPPTADYQSGVVRAVLSTYSGLD